MTKESTNMRCSKKQSSAKEWIKKEKYSKQKCKLVNKRSSKGHNQELTNRTSALLTTMISDAEPWTTLYVMLSMLNDYEWRPSLLISGIDLKDDTAVNLKTCSI